MQLTAKHSYSKYQCQTASAAEFL